MSMTRMMLPRLGRVGFRMLLLMVLLLATASIASIASAVLVNRKISGVLPAFSDAEYSEISPDGQIVVFIADRESDDVYELYSVPLAGGSDPVKLNGPLPADSNVSEFAISPDSSRVVYIVDRWNIGLYELHSVPLGGGMPVQLTGALVLDPANAFQISPDSSRVAYRSDEETAGVYELYSIPLAGGSATKLNDLLTSGGNVEYFQVSPDSSWVVYLADQESDNVIEVYSVPLAGGLVLKLNGPLVTGGDVRSFQISPDSSRVVVLGDLLTDDVVELGSVLIRGGDAKKLNGPLVTNGDVHGLFKISPNGNRVVYLADQETDGVTELYSVRIGGANRVKLNNPVVSGGSIYDFEISADSSRVVYYGDQDTEDVLELYSVPPNGGLPSELISLSAAAVKLNGPLAGGQDVLGFQLTPDGSRVIYYADEETDEQFELFQVPSDGGTPPLKLTGPLISNGDVDFNFAISPDSSRVVYRADQTVDEVKELYSVPTAGAATPFKLNGPLVAGGDVGQYWFRISPDSSRVVYTADQETDDQFELFVTYDQAPLVNFETPTLTASEADGVVISLVRLNVPLTSTVQVDYAVTGGTAIGGGVDYSLAGGTLLFAPGVLTQPLQITIIDDSEPEPDETVIISLSSPQNAGLGSPSLLTLTLQANDGGAGSGAYQLYLPLVRK